MPSQWVERRGRIGCVRLDAENGSAAQDLPLLRRQGGSPLVPMAGRGSVLGCWEIEHTDIERAVAAKCPIEMGGYDSLEQLQQVWDTRCPNDSAPMTNKDANNADA